MKSLFNLIVSAFLIILFFLAVIFDKKVHRRMKSKDKEIKSISILGIDFEYLVSWLTILLIISSCLLKLLIG
jgi:hypothetical protein